MEEKKKYYWIKLKTDFFDENTIDWLMSQKNGCEYVVLYQMLCLKTANSNGSLTTKIGEMIVPYDVEKIVRDTKYFDSDTVIVALELYKKLGLIYENKEGLLTISNYTMMVGSESASKEAVKKREYRNRLKAKEAIQLPEHTEKIGKKKDIEVDKKGTNCPTEIRDKRLEIRNREYISLLNPLSCSVEGQNVTQLYEQKIGTINANVAEQLADLLEQYGEKRVVNGIQIAHERRARTIGYVAKCVENPITEQKDEYIDPFKAVFGDGGVSNGSN